MMQNKAVFYLNAIIYQCLEILSYNYVISQNKCQNLRSSGIFTTIFV